MPTREEKQKLIAMGSRIAREHGIDPSLLLALIEQESDWNPKAVSSTGAQGLGQLMPGTARGLKVSDPFDPEQNLRGAARYLRQQLQTFGGSEEKALAAYNAGPGAVKKYGGVPPFDETKAYVPSVQRRRAGYAGERWKPIAVPLTYEEEAAAIERRLAPKKARPVPPAEETLTYEEEAAAIERRLAPKKERPLYQKAAVTLGKPGDFFRASLATLAKSQGEKGIRYLDESMAEAFGAGWDAFLDRGKAYEPRLFREMFRLKPGTIASRAAGWADYAADLLWNPGDVLTGAAVGKGLRLASKGAARLPAV
ncbi:MAG: lytic transglycosylase domain-containing protein [Candidatus Methylomirabilales bacterium]